MKKVLILTALLVGFSVQAYAELPTWKYMTELSATMAPYRKVKLFKDGYLAVFEANEFQKCLDSEFYSRKNKAKLYDKMNVFYKKNISPVYSIKTKVKFKDYNFNKQSFPINIYSLAVNSISGISEYPFLPGNDQILPFNYSLICTNSEENDFHEMKMTESNAEAFIKKYPSRSFFAVVEYEIVRFDDVLKYDGVNVDVIATNVKIYSDKNLKEHLFTITPDSNKKNTQTDGSPAISTAHSQPLNGERWVEPNTGIEFVWVQGGCYGMGDYNSKEFDERPVHKVCVDGFWVGKYEVTNAQFRQFKSTHNSGEYKGHSLNGDDQPVVYVTWSDAVDYARWLSSKTGETYRLPTEAEWEFAARGGFVGIVYGEESDSSSTYCKGANAYDLTASKELDLKDMCYNCDDGFVVSAPVGKFKSNALDLHDMKGNVWEWCSDYYDRGIYAQHSINNPINTKESKARVIRSGSWKNGVPYVRLTNRGKCGPMRKYEDIGFRLIKTN